MRKDGCLCVCGVEGASGQMATYKALLRKKRLASAKKRRDFAQERLFFALTMTMFAFNFCSPTRSLWTKERSSYWGDHIASQIFSSRNWLDNFRMSQATFIYVCDVLRSTIENADIKMLMRKAITVEKSCFDFGVWQLPYYWTIVQCLKS